MIKTLFTVLALSAACYGQAFRYNTVDTTTLTDSLLFDGHYYRLDHKLSVMETGIADAQTQSIYFRHVDFHIDTVIVTPPKTGQGFHLTHYDFRINGMAGFGATFGLTSEFNFGLSLFPKWQFHFEGGLLKQDVLRGFLCGGISWVIFSSN